MRGDAKKRVTGGMLPLAVAFLALVPGTVASAQDVADIDYEHLSFRGFALEVGYLWPDRVEPTESYGVRLDMGYAGPGLRIVPSVTYWKSALQDSEIFDFEERVRDLIAQQNGGVRPALDLGTISYTDVALGIDGHVVWRLPLGLLTFGGLGVSAHVINGAGSVIQGTFVEDLIDSVEPGFNLHVGAEYPLTERMRIYSTGRYEVTPGLRYFQVRGGWQFMTGPNAPGEGPGND